MNLIKIKTDNEFIKRRDELYEFIYNSLNIQLQKELINNTCNPIELFNLIKKKFEQGNDLLPFKSLSQLVSSRFDYGNDIHNFFNKMNNLWDIIKESKDYENLNDSTFFNSIVMAMPPELDHFVALAKQATNVKSPQDLMNELTNHYLTKRGNDPSIMNVTVRSESEVIDEECGFCKSNNMRPFNNHSVKFCRKVKSLKLNNDEFKPTNILGRVRAIGIPEDKSQAILDTGATTTVTGRRDLFTNFRKLENKHIVTAGGIVNATGIGTINVKLKAGGQTMTWSISDTLYIPSLEVTLISTAKLKMKKLKLLYEPDLGKATICDAYTNAIWEIPLINDIIAFKIVNSVKVYQDSIYLIGTQIESEESKETSHDETEMEEDIRNDVNNQSKESVSNYPISNNESLEENNNKTDEMKDDQIVKESDKPEENSLKLQTYNKETQEEIIDNLDEMKYDQIIKEPDKQEENSYNNEAQEEINDKIDEQVNNQVNNKPKEGEDINNVDDGDKTNNQAGNRIKQTENIDTIINNDYAGNQSVNQLKRKDSPVQRPSPRKKQTTIPARAREERFKEVKRQQYENPYLMKSNNDIVMPKSYEHAMKLIDSQQWTTASQEELMNYNKNIDANSEPTIYKTRLVLQGFSQIPGLNYEETVALVTTFTTIRLLLALVANEILHVHQTDVKAVYLNGQLDEDICMDSPSGLRVKNGNKKGMKAFVDEIKKERFKSIYDKACLFYSNKNDANICVYVEDLLVLIKNIKVTEEIRSLLSNKVEMKNKGEASLSMIK